MGRLKRTKPSPPKRRGPAILAILKITGTAEARILGVPAGADEATVRKAWRAKIADAHPDQSGSHGAAAEVNAARDAMLRALIGATA